MNEFERDVRQKAEVARGACRRKGGAKSRRCSLPSDHLTAAQRAKLNGPVTAVKMNEPMGWENYAGLPDHLRREYLLRLIRVYRANQNMLSQMLGVRETDMRRELGRLDIRLPPGGQYPRGEEGVLVRRQWERFCSGVGGTDEAEKEKTERLETCFDGFPDAACLHALYELYRGTPVRVHLRVEVAEDG